MTPAVEANNVSIRSRERFLLRDVSFRLSAGERVAIIGPNGAGKSTLLRAISGELLPHSGTISLNGRDVRHYPAHLLAQQRAFLTQSVSVDFPFTVGEIVRMGIGHNAGNNVVEKINETLKLLGLSESHDRIMPTLSIGEQQRVQFARVFIQLSSGESQPNGRLLLLDKPTASLDLCHQLDVIAIARRCAKDGACVLAVLHDLNLAVVFATRIIVLHNGRIMADGPPSEIITDPLLRSLFEIEARVNVTPQHNTPFILPQSIAQQSNNKLQR